MRAEGRERSSLQAKVKVANIARRRAGFFPAPAQAKCKYQHVVCNPSLGEVEAGRREFKASLGYAVRPVSKQGINSTNANALGDSILLS